MQDELELMTKMLAESILEHERRNNIHKFYLILVAMVGLFITVISLLVFFYLSDRNIANTPATVMWKTEVKPAVATNQVCYNTDNEKLLKVRNKNGVKWLYKTYHNNDELVYITTAK